MIPLMNHLEECLTGIRTEESRTHKIKLFADMNNFEQMCEKLT